MSYQDQVEKEIRAGAKPAHYKMSDQNKMKTPDAGQNNQRYWVNLI
jgi:hypothetical protein